MASLKTIDYDKIDFHDFVDYKLNEIDLKIHLITEEIMKRRLYDFKDFINSIRREFSELYNWNEENESYFLNPLIDKWKYSFAIVDNIENLCFVSFSSVYGE